ncbi:hypothetical protein BDF20DRAFT_988226 [Mycotypha africana]|uniref:uncharacterized protein n=1 Tax=Mycotypha africana TaxID=64632 RepID=UPI00230102FE|nr:uncharacterized protein BDF20DRAFT_988226 [Mycotypha africana]KAI8977223.1 hypothetical protein BDF20DRAFT_988226 [Mycotypha africana]
MTVERKASMICRIALVRSKSVFRKEILSWIDWENEEERKYNISVYKGGRVTAEQIIVLDILACSNNRLLLNNPFHEVLCTQTAIAMDSINFVKKLTFFWKGKERADLGKAIIGAILASRLSKEDIVNQRIGFIIIDNCEIQYLNMPFALLSVEVCNDDLDTLLCESSAEELKQLKYLQQKAAKEKAQNKAEERRLFGKPILYGQVIQIHNHHFKKYLTVTGGGKDKLNGSTSEPHRLRSTLSSDSVGFFRIMPRYRIRFVGDLVRVGETVALQCVKPEGYLNIDYDLAADSTGYDVFSHTRMSAWLVTLQCSSVANQSIKKYKFSMSGQYIRMYHKEIEAYLEGPSSNSHCHYLCLKLENVDGSRGSKIRWNSKVRIRHVISRAYLSIDTDNVRIDIKTGKTIFESRLVRNPARPIDSMQDTTVFQFVPVSSPTVSGIPHGSFVRIQHVLTNSWLHAPIGEEDVASIDSGVEKQNDSTLSLNPSVANEYLKLYPYSNIKRRTSPVSRPTLYHSHYDHLNSIESSVCNQSLIDGKLEAKSFNSTFVLENNLDPDTSYYTISSSPDMYYHDCFSISFVDQELIDKVNYANEMLPQLHLYLSKDRQISTVSGHSSLSYTISEKEFESVANILDALIRFCTKSNEDDFRFRKGIPIEAHQDLLRDIGIIETVIDMIMAPFSLQKRKEIRRRARQTYSGSTQQQSYLKGTEKEAKSDEIVSNKKLRIILSLCYSLLRVFLIRPATIETSGQQNHETHETALRNQYYIFHKAGEEGMALFIEHLSYNIGAKSMMINLLEVVEQHSLISQTILDAFIEKASTQTDEIIEELGKGNRVMKKHDYIVSIRLLGALCQRSKFIPPQTNIEYLEPKTITTTSYRIQVSDRLFDQNNVCLMQSRVSDKNLVEVKFKKDIWRELNSLLEEQPQMTSVMESFLGLVYALSDEPHAQPNNFACQLIILYVDNCSYEKVALHDFTMDANAIVQGSNYYPLGSVGFDSDFFQSLKHWTFRYLDTIHHEFTDNTDEIDLLSSVLNLIHAQLQLGFFKTKRDIEILFRSLVHILDGRTDARNKEHYEYIKDETNPRPWYERYVLTEKNLFAMNTKIQILRIFDLIFDLRLRVRMSKLAQAWKSKTDSGKSAIDLSIGESELHLITTIFKETQLRERENGLMPILKDLLKYQYTPLKEMAVIIMHRLFSDSQELFRLAASAIVLVEKEQNQTYNKIHERLAALRTILHKHSFEYESSNQLHQIKDAIKDLQQLIIVPLKSDKIEPKYDETLYCRIFKNLNGCEQMIDILRTFRTLSIDCSPIYLDIFHSTFQLLCNVFRHDKEAQSQLILANIELLISFIETLPELAYDFAQLCSNNLYLSIHMREKNIIRILRSSKGQQDDHLLVLHDLMKTQGKFVKKNQDIVMKFFMDNRRDYIPFDSVDSLKSMHNSAYCINFISILAICAQGENSFGQSFARTIFSIKDIYEVVDDENICISLKSVMLKFLASVYLEDLELSSDISFHDNENILKLVDTCEQAIQQCLTEQPNVNTTFYNYVFRGVLAFLRSAFEYHISIEVATDVALKYSSLVDSIVKLLPLAYDDEKALQATLACLDSMINVSGFRGNMNPYKLRNTLKDATSRLNKLYARGYEQQLNVTTSSRLKPLKDSINESFQAFIDSIKLSQSVEQYEHQEFKLLFKISIVVRYFIFTFLIYPVQIGSHFNLTDMQSDASDSIESLITYLSTITTTNSSRRMECFQVATMKILEEIPKQYIDQQALNDPKQNSDLYEVLESKKQYAQNKLNNLGCTLVAQKLLSSPRKQIFDATLRLLISLLDGGNKNVQDKMEEYFYSIREESFFYSFHQRLQSGINSSKDSQIYLSRRLYKLNRQKHILENIMQQQQLQQLQQYHLGTDFDKDNEAAEFIDFGMENNNSTAVTRRRSSLLLIRKKAASLIESPSFSQPQLITDDISKLYQEISLLMVTNSESTSEFGSTVKDYKIMQDTMRVLQLMAEGHNLHLQRYLAKQPDNLKSFNIILDVVEYFHAIVPLCDEKNIRLIIQVLDTITELAQGCLENQVTIFNNKIINPMNAILRENYESCDYNQVNELKSKVVICLLSLLEGGVENSEIIFKEMTESLDLSAIKSNMNTIYTENTDKLRSKNIFDKLECGFLYCILVLTLSPALKKEQASMFFEDNIAFEYFQSHTGTIEVVMDYGQEKQLSRVLFPIPEVCQYLRPQTKDRFLWHVNRESPSSKIEDFVQQSEMIIYEIENQAMVAHNKYLSFLTNHSTFWWESAYGVSIFLNLLLMFYPELLDHLTHDDIHVPLLALSSWHPAFYALHLLDFIFRDSILQGVISSITLNVNSISRTAVLGIIVIYIHSIIAYMHFRKEFDQSKGLFCGSLAECFVTVLSHGVRSGGGIGDILEPSEVEKPSAWRTIFEMSFYLVVVVFLLNAIFGIIFDTFGYLRDERSAIQQDIKESVEFQRHSKKGFEDHVKNDHNIWQYLFFLVHLKNKDRTEYTGPESYVAGCLKNADYSFFPINRALGLQKEEQDDSERLNRLEELNQALLNKIEKLEESLDKLAQQQAHSGSRTTAMSPFRLQLHVEAIKVPTKVGTV